MQAAEALAHRSVEQVVVDRGGLAAHAAEDADRAHRSIQPGSARGLTDIDPHVLVLFGARGDLAKRKLLPGLAHLTDAGLMPADSG